MTNFMSKMVSVAGYLSMMVERIGYSPMLTVRTTLSEVANNRGEWLYFIRTFAGTYQVDYFTSDMWAVCGTRSFSLHVDSELWAAKGSWSQYQLQKGA